MKKNLFTELERLTPARHERGQSFETYRWSKPARQSARRKAIYLSRIGRLTAAQEQVVSATAEYLGVFFALPVRAGADFDPETFPACAFRRHPHSGYSQLRTRHLINEVLWLDRPEEALICMAVTGWDLCSSDQGEGDWGYAFGEAISGHAGVWSLRYLGDPGRSERAYRYCLRRSFALATHEALHVLGLDHCLGACNMHGSNCLSGPLALCPVCLRKFCWNRQLDLLPYLCRVRDFLDRWAFPEEAERYEDMIRGLEESRTACLCGTAHTDPP
jgi:hypothetical protein